MLGYAPNSRRIRLWQCNTQPLSPSQKDTQEQKLKIKECAAEHMKRRICALKEIKRQADKYKIKRILE